MIFNFKLLKIIMVGFILYGLHCSGPPIDPPIQPAAAKLVAPINGDVCTTAIVLNNNISQVKFQWANALDTDSYQLVVENQSTKTRITKTIEANTTSSIELTRGMAYSWWIVSLTEKSSNTGVSEIWQFYLEGVETTDYIPFSALLINPTHNQSIDLPANQTLKFVWDGNDLDNDIDHYNLFLSENFHSQTIENITQEEFALELKRGTIYQWSVKTIDKKGNTSYSENRFFNTSN
ncbi:MAG: hypothetical protein OXE55_00045 [Flavobacteriaceae bacterium]|nr:hypothetical protein [Flavobacteriaceae bacterium]